MIKELHGLSDQRSRFDLDEKTFLTLYHQHTFTHEVTLTQEKAYDSSFSFPVASITKNRERIAYTRALMFGKNHVELDVSTAEAFRQQGCAFETSLVLIEHLLRQGFIPQWSCWIHNEASIKLAQKLGFKFVENIHAYVWVDSFGPL